MQDIYYKHIFKKKSVYSIHVLSIGLKHVLDGLTIQYILAY